MPNNNDSCCQIPVCLKFENVEATEDFKDAMKVLFTEIFSEICNGENGNGNGDE